MARYLGSVAVRGRSSGIGAPRRLWAGVLVLVLMATLVPPALADHFPEVGPNVTADPNTGLDPGGEGQMITVEGTGYTPFDEVQVSQCHLAEDLTCGSTVDLFVDEGGSFSTPLLVTYSMGSINCDDPGCFVRARSTTDPLEEVDQASISFATGGENQPPVANDDQASTDENTSVNIDVLANDSDPDGDTVFVSDVSQPENGSTFINKDQTISYTPNEGFTGVDTFTYTASDFESTDTATVMVLVGDDGDSCEVEVSEGCTATTDSGVTGPDNPVSVTMTVPPGQPAGVYAVREIDQTVPKPAGAFEYIAPAGATEIFIEVSCDESQCPRLKNRRLDLQLTVIKENPDGTVKTLLPCVQGRRGQIVNPPPCVFSVVRDIPGSGDLIWTVKVLGEDPKAGGAR